MNDFAGRSKVDEQRDRFSRCAPQQQQPQRGSCCVTPHGPPPDRPDLAIYSQDEQFSLGLPPTWDSPDILTNFWNPFRLMTESSVTLRNLSPTATAVNGQVLFSTATFGIGQTRTLLGSQFVNLAPGQQTTILFPLPQAVLNAAEQRIAVHVRLVHPHDGKSINNEGSQLLADAYTSNVGRSFTAHFPVVNPLSITQQITLHAMPNLLNAVISPGAQVFGPLQQIVATLTINVPGSMHGSPGAPVRSDVTIVGRDQTGAVIDGLTYVVWVDN